jgi:hypothetical protein
MVKLATQAVSRLRASTWGLPHVRHHVLLHPYTGEVHVGLGKEASDEDAMLWEERIKVAGFDRVSGSPIDIPPAGFGEEPWIWVKQAEDPVVSGLSKLLNYQPSAANKIIGGPSPLAAAIASGLFGAGLGYAGGRVAETILPSEHFEPGVLSRNAALVGGLAGIAPAALWGAASHTANPDRPGLKAWVSGWPFREKDLAGKPYTAKNSPIKQAADLLREQLADLDISEFLNKRAWFDGTDNMDSVPGASQGVGDIGTLPMIQRDSFGRVVWGDPNTPPHIRAATVGLVNSASAANGYRSMLSPWDIASVTATGAARGLIVGKTLGAMAGLKPESQKQLQSLGVWGSMLSAVIPNAFPDPSRIFGNSG